MMNGLPQRLMDEFADRTGVTGNAAPVRYLWTDAFAVCNFLGLWRRLSEDRYRELAVELVRQVHHILGRYRPDDRRTGWISGLSEGEGKRHPTRGGLRIGKPLNERGPNDPPDPRLEWEQDGQYFHYLTKWMHALCCMAQETGERRFLQWAAELAEAAHHAFTISDPRHGSLRMVWKMSIDLSRPLVTSMGQHDPLDGLIACLELQSSPGFSDVSIDLQPAISDMTNLCAGGHWATDDALSIGGLLDVAARLASLGNVHSGDHHPLLRRILIEASCSLQTFDESLLHRPADRRLAFRELGLAIGMSEIERVADLLKQDRELAGLVDAVLASQPLAETIRSFWADESHRRNDTWHNHRGINDVMLATALQPDGYFYQTG